MSSQRWFVKQIRLFEVLTPQQLRRLEQGASVRSFPAKATIYLPSDAPDYVYVLVEGRVRLCSYTLDGKQAISAIIDPGEIFGELALASPRRRYDDQAEAMLASQVASIPKADFEAVLAECGSLALRIVKLVGWRLERIERRLRTVMFRTNRDRLIFLLLDLVEKYGRPSSDGIQLDIRLSHQELASLIGSTRESVTISLGELQSEGLVRVGRQRMAILNVAALAKAVGEPSPAVADTASSPTGRMPNVATSVLSPDR